MDFRKLATVHSVFALMLFVAASVSAQEINFSIDGGSTFDDSFTIGSGSSTTVEVYLSEIPPDTTLTSDGLFGFSLRGDLTGGSPGSIASASFNPQFDFPITDNFNSVAIEWEAAVLANAIPKASNILLGNFQYASSGPGVSTFSFSDLRPGADPGDAGWLTENAAELDQLIFGPGATDSFSLTLSTNAVPEPTSLVLIAFATAGLTVCRRR